MKSDIYLIGTDGGEIENALNGIEKTGGFAGLDPKSARILRLLAEEMTAMVSGVLKKTQSELWFENRGTKFELHLLTHAEVGMTEKEKLIAVSSRKKNEAEKGILGKLSGLYEDMVMTGGSLPPSCYGSSMFYGMPSGYNAANAIALEWSLCNYKAQVPPLEKDDEKDELEKSIIMQMADDVLMSVKSRCVEMIVKKEVAL